MSSLCCDHFDVITVEVNNWNITKAAKLQIDMAIWGFSFVSIDCVKHTSIFQARYRARQNSANPHYWRNLPGKSSQFLTLIHLNLLYPEPSMSDQLLTKGFLIQKHHLPLPSNCVEALHMKFRDEETNGRMSNYEEVAQSRSFSTAIKGWSYFWVYSKHAASTFKLWDSFPRIDITSYNSDDGLAGAGKTRGWKGAWWGWHLCCLSGGNTCLTW